MIETLVTNMFFYVDNKNWQSLIALYHPDIVYERPGYQPIEGVERLLHFYRDERVIEAGHHEIEQIVGDENHAACWGRFIGLGKDGLKIDVLFADVYSFERGIIKKRRTHFFKPAC